MYKTIPQQKSPSVALGGFGQVIHSNYIVARFGIFVNVLMLNVYLLV
jgi:hypothetical protein